MRRRPALRPTRSALAARATVDTGATVLARPRRHSQDRAGPAATRRPAVRRRRDLTTAAAGKQEARARAGRRPGRRGAASLRRSSPARHGGDQGPNTAQAAPVVRPHPRASAVAAASEVLRRDGKIAAGQFFKGSDQKDAMENEKPAHNVKLDPYCIDLYEVTAGEYKTCSDLGKCQRAPNEVEWPGITARQRESHAPLCTAGDPSRPITRSTASPGTWP